MILEGCKSSYIKSRCPEIYSLSNKSLSIKTIDDRHTDKIPFCIVEKMVDTREPRKPKHIDSQIRRIFIFNSDENNGNGISVCVTHRYGDKHICFPENIPNSKTSPPAFCALVDVVEERENLGPADLMVVLDIINEGENINSDKFSPEPKRGLPSKSTNKFKLSQKNILSKIYNLKNSQYL